MTALAVLVLAIVVLVLLWDWNWFKGPVERRVEAATGREFEIGGDLDVDLGLVPTIRADRLRLGNADWSEQADMARAERLEFKLALLPLLRGRVELPELHLDSPRILLERGAEGTGNWTFDLEDKGESRWELRPGRAVVEAGALRYLDAANDTDILVGIASTPEGSRTVADLSAIDTAPDRAAATAGEDRGDGDAAGRAAVENPDIFISGGGTWEGNEFTLEGNGESPLELMETEAPYRIDVRARAGATRAHARGTLLDPLRLRDFDLQFELAGQDLEDLFPLVGVALPPTPPYRLDGRLTRELDGPRSIWHYDDFTGVVGESDLGGDAAFTTGGERPFLQADLHSSRLDFDDLAGFIGAPPDDSDGETTNPELAAHARERRAQGRLLPDHPYELGKLRSMDADVRLKASRINSPMLPLDDMDAHLVLEAGLLRLDPLDFGVAGGTIRSTIRMDARQDAIRTDADINAAGLDLAHLLPDVEMLQNAVGRVSGHATVGGNGNSIARMLGSADGEVALGTGRGSISNLVMELSGIDLAEIIKFKLGGDRMIPIRCAFADFEVADGVMQARSLAFDTTDTILVGEGSIDLGEERLDLTIRPRPKDRSLLAFRTPLLVRGTFLEPGFGVDPGPIALRAAVALTLGSIAPPAALLATLELGPGEDSSCGGKYAQ
nr:AsmA family protein [Lysobacter sp. GX 14042]